MGHQLLVVRDAEGSECAIEGVAATSDLSTELLRTLESTRKLSIVPGKMRMPALSSVTWV